MTPYPQILRPTRPPARAAALTGALSINCDPMWQADANYTQVATFCPRDRTHRLHRPSGSRTSCYSGPVAMYGCVFASMSGFTRSADRRNYAEPAGGQRSRRSISPVDSTLKTTDAGRGCRTHVGSGLADARANAIAPRRRRLPPARVRVPRRKTMSNPEPSRARISKHSEIAVWPLRK